MEAELVRELPSGDGWQYEPKWDGFRGVLENAGGELALWSRNERPLLRYFPELRPLGEQLPAKTALDGEIVITRDGALDFDAMQMRLHPAESRIRRLAAEIPAEYVVFDMLVWDGEAVWKLPLEERRARVEALASAGFRVSPASRSVDEARGWLERFEALGHRRARRGGAAPGARRGGALRQGAGQSLPPRHEADPLARGQEAARLHVARAAAAARPERAGRRGAVRGLADGDDRAVRAQCGEPEAI